MTARPRSFRAPRGPDRATGSLLDPRTGLAPSEGPVETCAQRMKSTLTERQRLGNRAEDAAVSYLRAQGALILLRNYRCRCGELDIIAQVAERELAIVEVRTRSSQAYGGAAASVDAGKRQRLIRAASRLLQQRRDLARLRARFDVIVVSDPCGDAPRIEWIKHAFST